MHRLQKEILQALEKGEMDGATLRRIGEVVGESSPQKVKHHLTQLQRRGLVDYDSGAKTLRLRKLESISSPFVNIRIFGTADCGPATRLLDSQVEGFMTISRRLLGGFSPKHIVAIRALGESMNRANIGGQTVESGDFLLVDISKKSLKDGAYVLSTINGTCNIKKILIDRPSHLVYLLSESSEKFPPIVIHEGDDYQIEGMVVKVIKSPSALINS